MARPGSTGGASLPQRVEMLAGLSVAIDLGLGQPEEHMLGSARIACRLADQLGLGPEQRDTIYYSTLLMWIGCHADSQEYARWFGDDIAVRHDSFLVDWSGLPYLRFLLGNVARGEPMPERLKVMGALLRNARGQLTAMVHSHCSSAALLARHLGLPAAVERTLTYTFERYDGGGLPAGVRGDAIPIEMRIAQVADLAEVHHRTYGREGMVAMARDRSGGQFDPAVVTALVEATDEVLAPPNTTDLWADALSLAPLDSTRLDESALDQLVCALGGFADLKCPFTLGHSREVASLAAAAGDQLRMDEGNIRTLRRAGHLHDVGRLGVSSQVWSRPSELRSHEWERVRMHPYLTERVLHRIPGLHAERAVARSHHEHIDGTGYPLGIGGAALGQSERVLAAAVTYQSALEPRPYREAMDPDQAAARLRARTNRGALDPETAEAVLSVAGHRPVRLRGGDNLTRREREVLGLAARGMSNRQISVHLVLSEKTVRNHIEHIYSKIGVTNRVGASLYALEHGLVAPSGNRA